ncbi:MAG: hypothetical protein ABI378_05330 [Chitinophagaceae bacterium]
MSQILDQELEKFQTELAKLRNASTLLNNARKSVEDSAEFSQKLLDDHGKLSTLLNSFMNEKLAAIQHSEASFTEKIHRLTDEKLETIQRSEGSFSNKIDKFVSKKLEILQRSEENLKNIANSLNNEIAKVNASLIKSDQEIKKEMLLNKQLIELIIHSLEIQFENIRERLAGVEEGFTNKLYKAFETSQSQALKQYEDLKQTGNSNADLIQSKSRIQLALIIGLYIAIIVLIYLQQRHP